MQNENNVRCPKCDKFMYFNSSLGKFVCPYCGSIGERIDKVKGNEELLDDFIMQLSSYIRLKQAAGALCDNSKLKQSLIKLLNSL